MRFKLDENVPFVLKSIIEEKEEYEVDSVFHQGMAGVSDKQLFEHCTKEKRILITLDNDFSSQTSYSIEKIEGIIILKPSTQGKNALKSLFKIFLKKYSLNSVKGKRILIYPDEIKIRELEDY